MVRQGCRPKECHFHPLENLISGTKGREEHDLSPFQSGVFQHFPNRRYTYLPRLYTESDSAQLQYDLRFQDLPLGGIALKIIGQKILSCGISIEVLLFPLCRGFQGVPPGDSVLFSTVVR